VADGTLRGTAQINDQPAAVWIEIPILRWNVRIFASSSPSSPKRLDHHQAPRQPVTADHRRSGIDTTKPRHRAGASCVW
jgi:hypothetical protein